MTSVQIIQLGGFVIAGIGLALWFLSARKLLGRVLFAVGVLIVLALTSASPELRDPQFWQSPATYLGFAVGIGVPLMIGLLRLGSSGVMRTTESDHGASTVRRHG